MNDRIQMNDGNIVDKNAQPGSQQQSRSKDSSPRGRAYGLSGTDEDDRATDNESRATGIDAANDSGQAMPASILSDDDEAGRNRGTQFGSGMGGTGER